jgi:beta-phosphoglucomutase
MDNNKSIAALFDLDGVIFNTEPQYTLFWGEQGLKYHPEIADFDKRIKGQTLKQIFDTYFGGQYHLQETIKLELDSFESSMDSPWVKGVEKFLLSLKENSIRTAIVTSSDKAKMNSIYKTHPELKDMFDVILTAENFKQSKPNPDCYLLGARVLGTSINNCVVFEDSINGLKAGSAANMTTVGLATTLAPVVISPLCDLVINNFEDFTAEKMIALLRSSIKKV